MTALGFLTAVEAAGFGGLGMIVSSEEQRTALPRLLNTLFAAGPREDWVARLRAADIVSAPIDTLLEASNDPDVLANGYVTEVEYPSHGKRLKVHGSPWHFSETPAKTGVAPELGADTAAVLSGLGCLGRGDRGIADTEGRAGTWSSRPVRPIFPRPEETKGSAATGHGAGERQGRVIAFHESNDTLTKERRARVQRRQKSLPFQSRTQ